MLLIALPGFVWLFRRNAPITIAIGAVVLRAVPLLRALVDARWRRSASGNSRTMLDVTFGGGTKALRETSNSIFGTVRHCANTERRP